MLCLAQGLSCLGIAAKTSLSEPPVPVYQFNWLTGDHHDFSYATVSINSAE